MSLKLKKHKLLHLIAVYDLCNRLYVDTLVQQRRLCNEGRTLAMMIDCSTLKGKIMGSHEDFFSEYSIRLFTVLFYVCAPRKSKRHWASPHAVLNSCLI